jgi:indole-3-glycerol phosphate synthase
MSILAQIFADKRLELAGRKAAQPQSALEERLIAAPNVPAFAAALRDSKRAAPRLIAEVKRRSPSKGLLARDFNPLRLASTYAANGAAAISVLTDEKYFGGSLDHLAGIAAAQAAGSDPLPLLRKDFIFDRYQLLEARLAGASAILLIVAMLEKAALQKLIAETDALGMAALVEVHDRGEVDTALEAGAQVIGINNRNLHTFDVDLETTLSLLDRIPPGVTLVSESGIRNEKEIRRLGEAGVDAVLVGERIVTAKDPGKVVRVLAGLETSVSRGKAP